MEKNILNNKIGLIAWGTKAGSQVFFASPNIDNRQVHIRHEDCLACGSCMDACRQDSISFERKVGDHDLTSKPHHLDPGSVSVPSDKVNGRSRMRQPSGGTSGAGEGRVGAFVGDGTDRPTRLPGS